MPQSLTFTEEDAAFLTHINGQLTDSVTMLSHQVTLGKGPAGGSARVTLAYLVFRHIIPRALSAIFPPEQRAPRPRKLHKQKAGGDLPRALQGKKAPPRGKDPLVRPRQRPKAI